MKLIDKALQESEEVKEKIIMEYCPNELYIKGEYEDSDCSFCNCEDCWNQEYKEEQE